MQQEEREQHLAPSPKQVLGPGLSPPPPAQALMTSLSPPLGHGARASLTWQHGQCCACIENQSSD